VTYLLVRLVGLSPARTELAATAIMTPVIFIFAEVLPKNLFQRDADRLLYRTSRLLWLSNLAFRATGLIRLLRLIGERLIALIPAARDQTDRLDPRRQMAALLREGVAEGLLTPEQTGIIDRVIGLASIRIGSVMIPRRQMVAIRIDADRQQFVELVRRCNYSRLPVYRDDPKHVVGIVNVHEVLACTQDRRLEDFLYPPVTVRPNETVSAVLLQMQRARRTMAIVIDRWGNCIGLVTLKDLVEEIVGELSAW